MLENYKQCTFKITTKVVSDDESSSKGYFTTIGWIPEWAAKVGNEVELKEFGEMGFWKITEVGDTVLNKEALATQSRAYKNFSITSLLKSNGGID